MRIPGGYPRIAFFSIVSVLALLAVSGGGVRSSAVPAPSAEELSVIASAGGGHSDAPTPAAPPATTGAPPPAAASAPLDAVTAARASATVAPLRVAAVTAEAAISTASPPTASPAPPVAGAISDGPRSTALSYGDRTRKRVALTFDAGADVGYAADILDTLAHEHAVASFGMTGTWAEQNPLLVQRMAAEGHQLINHTWSHASFTGLSTGAPPLTRAQRWAEIDRTEAAIQRIAGVSTLPYFRPPYGDMDASVLADVGARGYTVTAMWAVDSLGWNGLSAPRIAERTLALTSPGAILIFHVGAQSQDAAALPGIIEGLRASGYDFVSLAALTNG